MSSDKIFELISNIEDTFYHLHNGKYYTYARRSSGSFLLLAHKQERMNYLFYPWATKKTIGLSKIQNAIRNKPTHQRKDIQK